MRLAWIVFLVVPLALSSAARLLAQPTAPPSPSPAQPTTPAAPAPSADEQILKSAHLPTTGPGLLDFFRKRTSEPGPFQLLALIQQLGDKTPALQDSAAAELISYGPRAIPALRQAANDLEDAEAGNRAKRCLQLLEANGPALTVAAAHLLAQHKPTGAAEVLLTFLPFAEDERVGDEISAALSAVALHDGKLDPALLKALQDKVPIRRSVAAEVLCQLGGTENRPAIRALLKDPKPSVRLRAAMSLTSAHEAEAIPVLIGLFPELSPTQTRQVDEFLLQLAGDWSMVVPQGNDALARKLRRDIWSAWWNTLDGPALAEEFRQRTSSDTDRERLNALIHQLGDESASARDYAQAQLEAAGNLALPLLRRAASSPDAKINAPAQKCLQTLLNKDALPPLPNAAARLLALRKPQGAAETLLAFLPCAEDESMVSEVQTALAGVAVRDGKLEPALVKALQDKLPQRRIAAAEALCQAGLADARPEVRKLLKDADLSVRLKAALALAGGTQDKEAIPVLIALLGELPADQGGLAEEYLRILAGEKAPNVLLGTEDAARMKCREAWEGWWKENEAKIELTRLDNNQRLLGYTLLIENYSPVRRTGRVFEIDQGGRIRWELSGLSNPVDAQVLPGNRVLVAEQGASRVSERDLKGTILWQKQVNQPLAAQRLPNGNTFIATNSQLLEVDRSGKAVFTYNRTNGDIIRGQKFSNGHMAFISYDGTYMRLDAAGKTLKTTRIQDIPNWGGNADVLPNDRILFAMQGNNRVIEYDGDGKNVWEANVQFPMNMWRMANGHTLVIAQNGVKLVELDRAGKQVWEYKENIRLFRAKRR